MSASIIQTRRAKEKEREEDGEEEGKGAKGVPDVDEVEANVVQVMVQDEGDEEVAHAVPIRVEAKQDSHVQIIASGEPPSKVVKLDNSEEYYVINQAEAEQMEEEERSSQHDTSQDLDSTRGYSKKPQKYRRQWEEHPMLASWLMMLPGNHYRAWCRQCGCPLITQLKVLLDHARCRKHTRREGRAPVDPPVQHGGRLGAASKAGTWGKTDANSQQLDVSYGDSDRVTYSIGLGNQKVGFIGAGKISQAIASGMMNKGLTSSSCIQVSSPSDRNQGIWKRWKCKTMHDNNALIRQCDVVFLAVAPAELESLVAALEPPNDGVERCFISTVSGVSQERLTQMLSEVMPDEPIYVIRCVPSKTVAIGEGICVYSAPHDLPHTWLLTMETVFSALGLCQKVEEHMMNVHSAAFGSGPAYVAAFIDALATGAANHGVRWEDAVQMAAQVTQGTAAMILTQGLTPAVVRRDAAAPGGNTISGLMALQRGGMEFAVMSAVDEATKRAKELGNVGEQQQ
ncbi:pyrroline-5-carboxylate reductase 3-like [Amphibalanus amphitrite]|uniref:pyrroline-5-carboxylate reductase 3-like n=1 Tax=Amphibalanus amphitrite TaxID=1232801 RepID=UPI001C90CC7F|nr:pyrroline-5-carboxylate reductase 3-like [Amphibalanus amphitrite]